jgi:membrane-associated phospholipid phosphatase
MEIIKLLQTFSNPFLDTVFERITFLGEETFYILVLSFIFWCVNKKVGYKLGFVTLSNTTLNGALKDSIKSARPIGVEGIRNLRVETATGYSFPSGHTQGATGFWVAISMLSRKLRVYIASAIIIVTIGLSRLYLGVHWPKDVIGGILFGAVWTFIAVYIFDLSERKGNKLILLIVLVPAIIGLIFFRSSDYIKSAATLIGFFIGYCIESKYINFTEKAPLLKQLIKYALGLGVTLLLKSLLKSLLPITGVSDFLRYIIIGLWISAGAPYIFKSFICRSEHNNKRNGNIKLN